MQRHLSEHPISRLAPLRAADSQGLFLSQRCGKIGQSHSLTVPSSSRDSSYAVTVFPDGKAECTCPGNRYHGHCKHATAARAQVCSWRLGQGTDQSLEQNVHCICPECKGPTELEV